MNHNTNGFITYGNGTGLPTPGGLREPATAQAHYTRGGEYGGGSPTTLDPTQGPQIVRIPAPSLTGHGVLNCPSQEVGTDMLDVQWLAGGWIN